MQLLIKFKYLFILLFVISFLMSLYYYFNDYSMKVKSQYIDADTNINLVINPTNYFNYALNEKIEDELISILDDRKMQIEAIFAKNFKIRKDQFKVSNNLNFFVNHNYSFDQELMENNLKNFLSEFFTVSKSLDQLNLLIQNDFYSHVNNLNLFNYFMNSEDFQIIDFNDYVHLKIPLDKLKVSLDKFSFPNNMSVMVNLQMYLKDFSINDISLNEDGVIIKKPELITINDFTADIYNIREDTMIITGYNSFYYFLIGLSFINILIYLYIYLRQKKYI